MLKGVEVIEKRGQVDVVYLDFAKALGKESHDHNLFSIELVNIFKKPQPDTNNIARWCHDWRMG